ncbi:hypothetical protein HPB51_025385 [Rhipicephalus microplus]|uniref:Zinc knuckle CX2CX4HX4C domain-containing protein n=1 Tax=Rhipicephalus microplus TaxID=6941 RepID=A0A9J6DE27_RHIMP|nr:hypothetical protein HPB51_025385 [Rhipicephalus microplus]
MASSWSNWIYMSKSVPNLHQVGDVIIKFEYEDVARVCRRCCRTGHHVAKCTISQCVRCGMIGHDQCALKCKHCGGDHSPSECKAQTNSLAVPPVAFSTSQEQASGVAEDQEAAPRDNEGSAQPQPEPTSERTDFSRGKSRRRGCNQLRPPPSLLPPSRRCPRLPVRPGPALLTHLLPRIRTTTPGAGQTLFEARSGGPAGHQGPPRRGWRRLRAAAPAALRMTSRYRSDPQ